MLSLRPWPLLLTLLAGGSPPSEPRSEPIRIEITVSAATAPVGSATLLLHPLSPSGEKEWAPSRRLPVSVPGKLEVEVAGSERFRLELVGEGLWAASQIVDSARVSSVSVEAIPGGRLLVPLLLGRDEAPLASIGLGIQRVEKRSAGKQSPTVETCPVVGGSLDCAVPAGRLDLRLRSERHAPAYFWDVSIPPGQSVRLAPIALHRGSSLSGWVRTQDDQPLDPRCQVEVVPEMAVEADGLTADPRLRALRLSARPNPRGFFQIHDVPVGRYRISASQPGSATVSQGPLEIRADLEAQLSEPLVLTPPIQFRISVEPPVDAFGQAWKILLLRRSVASGSPREQWPGALDPEGTWRTPPLSSGAYEILIRDGDSSTWKRETLDVEPGEPDLHLEIDLVEVAGLLRLGREPLAAELRLGQGATQIRFQADGEGRFSGFLPVPGPWRAEVRSSESGLMLDLEEPVEVRVRSGQRRARVEIVIPDTRISGEVLDEAGRPVPGATVVALRNDRVGRSSQMVADSKGRFVFRGLPAGGISLIAEEGESESEVRSVLLAEEEDRGDVRLVLRSAREWAGRVVGPGGPVPGARLFAFSSVSGLGSSSGQQADTGPDGRFRLSLVGNPPSLSLVVMAPGYAFHMENVLLLPGREPEIRLDPHGGELTVLEGEEGPPPVLVKDGTFLPLQILDLWARLQGSPARGEGPGVFSQMEAGAYRLCRGLAAISKLREGGEPPAATCSAGVLAPRGQLTLSAPRAASASGQPGG